jgi:VCBS repeat protein/ASPIC/UnbV protein
VDKFWGDHDNVLMPLLRSVCVLSLLAAASMTAQQSVARFERLQPELFTGGATLTNAFADYDRNGTLDLFVGFNGTPNRLYRNEHGRFQDVAMELGVADARPTRAAAWGDYDGDGDPDLLVGFAVGKGPVLKLYRNDSTHFADVTATAGLVVDSGAVRQFSWIDFDGDGDLDLFVAMRDRANLLFQNDRGHFSEIATSIGLADTRKSVGAVWFDYDQDGWLDLYVANMDGDRNALFHNDHGHFTDVAESAGLAWGGRKPNDVTNGTVRACAADVNGDGRFDIFTANYGRNGLFLNRGGGKFQDVSDTWGVAIDGMYDTCALADFDNDGRIDLYVNGTVTGGVSYRDYLFHNTGTRFEDITPDSIRALESDHGALWADVDGDGAEDLSLMGTAGAGMHALLRNAMAPADAARSLSVRVVDPHRLAMRAGAEVRVYAGGTRRLLGVRLVDTGSGYNSQSDMPVHFGLPSMAAVDVEVIWPAAGKRVTTSMGLIAPRSLHGRALTILTGR